ncbi:hypothetical protein C1645_735245 [Glomus cerebriforme]|uniref:BTB/POZ domain-containing protein n=1 Tax=Glomus cerebriforme TaxID=658196 RepID=A0A397TBY4_9GLOM|nr:hypothetical protein C1645_735245 [Glomus cerebriforme]
MSSNFHLNLSKDLSLILNDADDYNVIIQVGENQNTKEFRAHSVILRARSSYFKGAFSSGWIVNKNDMIVFNKPNITPIVFEMILKYIYTGELDLTKQLDKDILGLLVATDELLLEELFNHVQDYLIKKRSTWVQKNLVLVLHNVFRLVKCEKLIDYCLEYICADPQPVITSKEFPFLDKDILYTLLERNDLQVKEIDIWDCLIKWGIEQTSSLSKNDDKTKWKKKDYQALKNTLKQFIPLIRFLEISPADYFDKIRPYKIIIPNHINEKVEEFYFKGILPKPTTFLPQRRINQSKIIKQEQFNLIINCIKKNEPNLIFDFKLLHRKSCDGNKFIRNLCMGQGAILILIKVKNSKKIFGGYNPIGWSERNKQDKFLSTTKSFIFSFQNNEDIKNMIISRVIQPSLSIHDRPKKDVIVFGVDDLELVNDILYLNYSGAYEQWLYDDEVEYDVENVEAFKAFRK